MELLATRALRLNEERTIVSIIHYVCILYNVYGVHCTLYTTIYAPYTHLSMNCSETPKLFAMYVTVREL